MEKKLIPSINPTCIFIVPPRKPTPRYYLREIKILALPEIGTQIFTTALSIFAKKKKKKIQIHMNIYYERMNHQEIEDKTANKHNKYV